MMRETLVSEIDVPDNGNGNEGPGISRTCQNENEDKRTRGEGVVGVRALSVDSIDRSTGRR